MWSNLLSDFEHPWLTDVSRIKTKQESNVSEKNASAYFFGAKLKIKNINFLIMNV